MSELHIWLTDDFFNYVTNMLTMHVCGYGEIRSEMKYAKDMLAGTCPDMSEGHNIAAFYLDMNVANINDAPIEQTEWVNQYYNLHDALEQYCLTTAYFLKIQNYVPAIIKRFGIHHSVSASKQQQATMGTPYLGLGCFTDPQLVIDTISQEINDVFDVLDRLEDKISNDTMLFLASDKNKDSDRFAHRFYQSALTEREHYFGRIEYDFYETHGIPLGMLSADIHVQKYIGRTFCDKVTNRYYTEPENAKKLRTRFPSILIQDGTIQPDGNARHAFMESVKGSLPIHGVILGAQPPIQHTQRPRVI